MPPARTAAPAATPKCATNTSTKSRGGSLPAVGEAQIMQHQDAKRLRLGRVEIEARHLHGAGRQLHDAAPRRASRRSRKRRKLPRACARFCRSSSRRYGTPGWRAGAGRRLSSPGRHCSRASLPFSTRSVIDSSIECITSWARNSTSDRNHSASSRSMYGKPTYATTHEANAIGNTRRNMIERNIARPLEVPVCQVARRNTEFRPRSRISPAPSL